MNQQIKSVKYNFIMNFILTLSTIVFPLITFPYVSRILLPAGTGRVSFVTSIVSYFSMFGMLGIANYGIRQCAKCRDDKDALSETVQEIFIINSMAMMVSTILYIIAIFTVPRLAEDRTLFLINILTLIFTLLGVEWVYKALEQYQYITIRSVAFKIISLVLMFILVKQESDYVTYGTITVLAAVGANLLNFINLRKYIYVRRYQDLDLKQHLRPTMSFFFLSIATVIYTNLDVVLLGFMHGNDAVGYYNAAVKIKGVLVTLVTSLGAVLLPRLSFYIQQKRTEEFEQLTKKSLDFILVAALPLCLYFMLYAKEGLLFLSGQGYEQAIIPMMVLMPTLVFIGISNLIGIQILVPLGRENIVVQSVCLGAIVDLVVNIILTPTFGVIGAAIGNVAAEFVVVFYQWYRVKDLMKKVTDWGNMVKIVLFSFLAMGTFFVAPRFESTFVTLVVTSLLYFGVYGVGLIAVKEVFITDIVEKLKAKLSK